MVFDLDNIAVSKLYIS